MDTEYTGRILLVIDDHEDLLVAVKRMLETSGFAVLTASNGAEGLNVLMQRKGRVDGVVLDLYMPKLNGAHLAELIRIAWPVLPVLLISAYVDAANAVIGHLELPVLAKPFTMPALLEAVTRLLEPPAAE